MTIFQAIERRTPSEAPRTLAPERVGLIDACRSCGSRAIEQVLDLGMQPIANALVKPPASTAPDDSYPLELLFCSDCALLQISATVPAEILFKADYPYFSSQNPSLLKHGRDHAERLMQERDLGPDSLVVEVASNDGYLLRNFVDHGIPVLGIDPADGPAAQANVMGVPTRCEFFSHAVGMQLAAEGRQADVIIASNVVAHVDEINDFVAGFAPLLKADGIVVLEFAYAVDMIASCEFDTIYHEHLFFHTLHGLAPLVQRHGLHIVDAERLSIHGGSLRVRLAKTPGGSDRLRHLWEQEEQLGVANAAFYSDFASRVATLRSDLRALLLDLSAKGKRVACYGAAAKGSTMVNYLDLGKGFFDFVVDRSIHKQGKIVPGQRIPIRGPEALMTDRPDYVLLLAWNFADDIIAGCADYVAAGGRFIVPVPHPRIL